MNNTICLSVLTLLATATIAAERGPAVPDYAVDKLADSVYVIHGPLQTPNPENQGFMNNPGFVLTSSGVVVVDPGSSLQSGEMVLRALKTISKEPVAAIFNTHVHGDHWLGNQALRAAYPDVPIYGHPRMLKQIEGGAGDDWVEMMERLTEGKTAGTKVIAPDRSLTHGETVVIGKTTFRMHDYGKAHTETDLMIEVVELSVVFLGDNVLVDRVPRIDDGDIQGNIAACTRILETGAKIYVPGHGRSGDSSVPDRFRRYLTTLYQAVLKYYDEGLSDFEMKDQVAAELADFAHWSGFDEQLGRHISITYLQVEEAEF